MVEALAGAHGDSLSQVNSLSKQAMPALHKNKYKNRRKKS
jgi:hypothetical protein